MSSALELLASDPQLQTDAFKALHEKYGGLADEVAINNTKAGLESKGHKVTIADSGAQALDIIKSLIPDGATVYNTSSVTLNQIGFVPVLINGNDGKWINEHGKAIEASKGDHQTLIVQLRLAAGRATHSVATVDAVAENGDFYVADGSSTRIVPFVASENVIVVIGANKLVKTEEEAKERQTAYIFGLESARVRKAYGWPSALLSNAITVSTSSATPGRIHFVIVKEKLGF